MPAAQNKFATFCCDDVWLCPAFEWNKCWLCTNYKTATMTRKKNMHFAFCRQFVSTLNWKERRTEQHFNKESLLDCWHNFHCKLQYKHEPNLPALILSTLSFPPHSLCLRVQPPSWKLKYPRAHRSHFGPVTPGWHRHWPFSSQSNDLEPNELQWHGTHAPPVAMPCIWGWRNTDKEEGVVHEVQSRWWN